MLDDDEGGEVPGGELIAGIAGGGGGGVCGGTGGAWVDGAVEFKAAAAEGAARGGHGLEGEAAAGLDLGEGRGGCEEQAGDGEGPEGAGVHVGDGVC